MSIPESWWTDFEDRGINADYIRKQLAIADSSAGAVRDDALWRIASHANVLPISDQEVNDDNRAEVESWIDRNRECFEPLSKDDFDSLALLQAGS